MSHPLSGPVARIELVIASLVDQVIHRHCARCKAERPFASSGRFRVNAQKKLIDVWLIWRCATCDQTWNQAVHERCSVRALPTAELEAFTRNDVDLARHHAELMATRMVTRAEEARVERRILVPLTGATKRLEVAIAAPPGNGHRLDRVLAMGLGIGRGEVTALAECGALVIMRAGARALRRPALDGQLVAIDLTRCETPLRDGSCTLRCHARI